MKIPPTLSATLLAFAPFAALAQLTSFSFTPDASIPDPTGVADFTDTRTVTTAITSIADLNVRLVIAGDSVADNGNYFVSLNHDSGYAVLLNRAGRRSDELLGYPDNGFNVTFDDQASQGDIHVYRLTLFGNHDTPVDVSYSSPLTGSWVADGRSASPTTVLDTSPRLITPLAAFNGLNPNGTWTLLIDDLFSGGSGRLVSWSLDITPVPEPAETSAAMGLVALTAAWLIRRHRK